MQSLVVAFDSVGIDPLGHARPGSIYSESAFLFPRGGAGPLLDLPDAPVEGALVETDVTGGRTEGSIECAITYTSIFTGRDALAAHGLVRGLGADEALLRELLATSNLFACFGPGEACLANAIFPAHLAPFGSSHLEDLLPRVEREALEARVTFQGRPVVLRGQPKHGFAELFTACEVNQNPFVLAARRAGVRLRTWDDVRAGQALTASLTHALERDMDLSLVDPAPLPLLDGAGAAEVLARLARAHRFTFYKVQLADLVAHTGRVELARETFALIERFLGELLIRLGDGVRVVVTSDHGHLEQVGFTRGHPKNRVPTWVFGPGAREHAGRLTRPEHIFELVAEASAGRR